MAIMFWGKDVQRTNGEQLCETITIGCLRDGALFIKMNVCDNRFPGVYELAQKVQCE